MLGDGISGRNNCHATEKGDELTPFHGCSSAITALSEILDHSRLPPDAVPEMAPHRPRKLIGPNVSVGSKATVRRCPRYFRFTPDSRHSSQGLACLKGAKGLNHSR